MTDSSPTTDDGTLGSSPISAVTDAGLAAATEGTPTSVLDAVEAALNPDRSSTVSRTDGEQPGKDQERANAPKSSNLSGPDEVPGDDELSDQDRKVLSQMTQDRIRHLAAQKNSLRSEVADLRAELEPLKSKATSFETLTNYLTEHDINPTEANNALEITRLIKGHDYDRAYQLMTPIYQELAKRSGAVLDEDLQEDVRLGHVPLPRAKELQRGRAIEANGKVKEQSRSNAESRRQQNADESARVEHVHSAAKAADDWAAEKASSVENWEQKAELVAAQVNVFITREGFPKTIEGVVDMSERALAQVEKSLGAGSGKDVRGRSASAEKLPSTALEALEMGLAATN